MNYERGEGWRKKYEKAKYFLDTDNLSKLRKQREHYEQLVYRYQDAMGKIACNLDKLSEENTDYKDNLNYIWTEEDEELE